MNDWIGDPNLNPLDLRGIWFRRTGAGPGVMYLYADDIVLSLQRTDDGDVLVNLARGQRKAAQYQQSSNAKLDASGAREFWLALAPALQGLSESERRAAARMLGVGE